MSYILIITHRYADNRKGVIYFHPLPPSCVGLIDPTITSATSLGLALLDLKTAFDMVAKIGAKKDSYMSLIDRCMGLVVNICSSIEQGSPMPLDGDMRCLEKCAYVFIFISDIWFTWGISSSTCTAVRDTVLKLSGEDTPGKFSNEDDIEQEITTVQNGLTAASALFDVGVSLPVSVCAVNDHVPPRFTPIRRRVKCERISIGHSGGTDNDFSSILTIFWKTFKVKPTQR